MNVYASRDAFQRGARVFRFSVILVLLMANPLAGAADMDSLLRRCAPEVHPVTMGAIVRQESGGNYLVIGDDGDFSLPRAQRVQQSIYPVSLTDAVRIAADLDSKGHVFGVGLGQVTNRNLKRMGVSVSEAFDPCRNLQLSRDILLGNYQDAEKQYGSGQGALLAAISKYNTGSFVNGHRNGYVAKVVGSGRYAVPELKGGGEARRILSSRKAQTVASMTKGSHGSKKVTLAEAVMAPASISGFVDDVR